MLLVIAGIVLDRGTDVPALYALHIGYGDPGGEIRILGIALKVAPGEWSADDVYARREQDITAKGTGLIGEGDANTMDKLGIPAGGHGHASGKRGSRPVHALWAGAVGTHAVRPIGHDEGGDAQPLDGDRVPGIAPRE